MLFLIIILIYIFKVKVCCFVKRCILKIQAEPIVIEPKSVEITKPLDYSSDNFSNTINSLVGSCLGGMIIDNWVSNFLYQHHQGTLLDIFLGWNYAFKRLDNGKMWMYLSEQQLKTLFVKLIEIFFDLRFASDFISLLMVKNQQRPTKHMSANFD